MTQKKILTKHSRGCGTCWYREEKYCTYFVYKKQKKKEIPEHVLDKGCKFYTSKEDQHPLFKLIFEVFDGEVI
tara:strand:+ start:317 stop:535 length:219 start_codon:yes stop_codon:yes gene_type:complete